MGRPCEFDRQRAVEIAARLFHEKGYEATSIEDLTTALNISRASLYNSFGDKHGLLMATMTGSNQPAAGLDKTGPVREVMREFLKGLGAQKRGCFYLTLGAELATGDAEVRKRVRQSMETTRLRIRDLIEAARAAGEVRADLDAEQASRVLLGATVSLLTLARVHPDRHVTSAIIDHALQILD